jgi:hypothetical protein
MTLWRSRLAIHGLVAHQLTSVLCCAVQMRISHDDQDMLKPGTREPASRYMIVYRCVTGRALPAQRHLNEAATSHSCAQAKYRGRLARSAYASICARQECPCRLTMLFAALWHPCRNLVCGTDSGCVLWLWRCPTRYGSVIFVNAGEDERRRQLALLKPYIIHQQGQDAATAAIEDNTSTLRTDSEFHCCLIGGPLVLRSELMNQTTLCVAEHHWQTQSGSCWPLDHQPRSGHGCSNRYGAH